MTAVNLTDVAGTAIPHGLPNKHHDAIVILNCWLEAQVVGDLLRPHRARTCTPGTRAVPDTEMVAPFSQRMAAASERSAPERSDRPRKAKACAGSSEVTLNIQLSMCDS